MKHILLGLTPLVTIPFLLFLNFLSGQIVNGTSKGALSQRYYSIQSTNHRLDRFDYVVTVVMRLVLTTTFSAFAAMAGLAVFVTSSDCSEDKFKVVLSCADKLLNETFDFVGPLTLAVIALVAFWGTYNKKECLFYQIEDIYKEKKLQDKLVDALFCYCFTFVLKTITTVLPKSEVLDLQIAKFLLFVIAIALCLYGVFRSLGAIVATTEMIFNPNDSVKLLNCLHLRVRQKRKNLSIPENGNVSFEDSLDYLFDEIKKSHTNFFNSKIRFVDYCSEFSEYTHLPRKKITFSFVAFVSVVLTLQIGMFLKVETSCCNLLVLLVAILAVTKGTLVIVSRVSVLRHTLVYLHVGSWGFIEEGGKLFSLMCSRAMDREKCDYLKVVYNIVTLFRDMLTTDEENIRRCLKFIYDFVEEHPEHYIIYACCRYLLHIENPDLNIDADPQMRSAFVLDKRRTLSHNTEQLVLDLIRPESLDAFHKSVNKFFFSKPSGK